MNGNYHFISNNIKRIKASEKRLKVSEYLKNNINDNGFTFLQETHSLSNVELKWKDEFGKPLFFSHRKSYSCGVAIGYCGTEAFKVVNTACDKNGRILILDAELNGTNFFLINFYNSNTESEQLSTFSTLQKLLETFDDYNKKNIVFGGDFNLIFYCKLDASGGNPILKRKSLAKLIEIKETLCLCDIWRIRNPNVKRFTFLQNHVSGFIELRLDSFLISNALQESIIKTDVLASFCTDHSPILFSLQLKDMPTRGKGLWKFNNSLVSSDEYVEKMKIQISETLHMLDQDKINDKHLRWEFLKYEIRKFTINFSKKLVKEENKD